MAGELLLINPRRRRRHAKTRRKNPIARRRVHHKVAALRSTRRRRRNPIGSTLKAQHVGTMLKTAALAGAGSVAVDAVMGQVRPLLPASIQTGYAYAAAKGAVTVILGILAKKSLGSKAAVMAEGALTVQAANLITSLVPTGMTMGGRSRMLGPSAGMRGLGYFTSGGMLPRTPNLQVSSPRIGPNMAGLGYFNQSSTAGATRKREGVSVR